MWCDLTNLRENSLGQFLSNNPADFLQYFTWHFVSLLIQNQKDQALVEIHGFIEYYKSLDKDYKSDGSYKVVKKFINNNQQLTATQTEFILMLQMSWSKKSMQAASYSLIWKKPCKNG